MIKLIIGNSYSEIIGLKRLPFSLLRKLLSYQTDEQAAYFSGGWAKTNYLVDKHGSFPTGLLNRVLGFCLDYNIDVDITDDRKIPKIALPYSVKGVKPYPAQLSALEAAMLNDRGIISMPTGTGKSLVIALIAAQLNVKTLVVVPSLEIKKQLKEALDGFLGKKHKITVENIDSSRLEKSENFECLIIDEAHHVAATTYQNLNRKVWAGIYYRFFLTATPFRNQVNEQLLFEGIAGDVIFNLPYREAVREGYIVPVEGYYLECPKKKTEATTWRQVYSELVIHNHERNVLIASRLTLLARAKIPTLCLVKEIAHGEILSLATGVPFANGQDEESRDYIRKFNTGEIFALIGTTGILGEGVDSKPCEWVIIAGLGKAKSAFLQQAGRAVRRYLNKETAKVVLVKDDSHKFTRRHYNEQVKILQEYYGVTPTKLDV